MLTQQSQVGGSIRRRIMNDKEAPTEIIVRNSKGKKVLLNQREKAHAEYLQRIINDIPLGFNISITTLTTIIKRVSEQKFFKIPFADYVPVRTGEGAWSDQLITYTSFQLGDDFEKGLVNTGADNSRLASTDAGVSPIAVPVRNWAKQNGWSLFDLNQAQKSGNWDIVTSKEVARRTNWDLGLQRTAFLGLSSGGSFGLLNQTGVTINTALITMPISSMNPTQLSTFLAGLLAAYRTNSNYTAYPTHFLIPEDDYNGMAIPTNPTYPIKSMIEMITDILKRLTQNPNFKVLPIAYAIPALSQGALSHHRYALYNYDDSSIRMDVPVDYTSTIANTVNGFTFQNVGYGQFTGVGIYRPGELMYFDNLNA